MLNKKTAIVTDSTCDIPQDVAKEYGIRVVPLRIVYNQEEYRDRVEISPESIYARLEYEIPKSTLPLAEDVIAVLDELKAEGYEQVLVLTLSANLSGTHNLISLLSEDYEGMDIHVVNTATLSLGLGFLVIEAAKAIKETESIKEAMEHVKAVRKNMTGLFVLKTLKYLKLGGRIGKVSATLGSVLHIKPIIRVNDEGIYETLTKARGRNRSIESLIDKIRNKYQGKCINLAIVHGDAYQEAVKVYEKIAEFAHVKLKFIEQVSPVIGLHTGPGLLGVFAYEA